MKRSFCYQFVSFGCLCLLLCIGLTLFGDGTSRVVAAAGDEISLLVESDNHPADGEKKEDEKKDGDKKEEDKKDGDKKESDKKDGDKKEDEKKDGDKKEDDKKDGEKKEDEKKPADPPKPATPPATAAPDKKPAEPAKPATPAPATAAPETKPAEPPKPATPPAPPAPESIELKKEPIRLTVKLAGTFDVSDPMAVRLKGKEFTAFELIEVVPHGTRVKNGDILAKFDVKRYDEALTEKKRAVELSTMSLREEELNYEVLQTNTPLTKEEIAENRKMTAEAFQYYYDTERDTIVRSQEMFLKRSEATLAAAKEELRQLEKMYEADDLIEETEEFILKRTRMDVESAEFSAFRARESHRKFMETTLPRLDAAMKRDDIREKVSIKRQDEVFPYTLEQAKIRLDRRKIAHEKELESLKKMMEDRKFLTLKAPQDGVVYYGDYNKGKWNGAAMIDGMLRIGELVKNDTVLMTVVPQRPNQIRVTVPEKDLHWVAKGITGLTTPVSQPDARLAVKVADINIVPGVNNDYVAILSVMVPERLPLMAGMNTSSELVVYEKEETFLVLTTAIKRDPKDSSDPSKGYVFVLGADNKTEKTRVKLGKVDGEKTEILSGVLPGQKILKKAE